MKIAVATQQELTVIRELAYQIWPTAYYEILSRPQLDYMLDKFYSVASLENQLLEKKHVFLVIKEEDDYLGFCSYELSCDHTTNTKLHKIYVLPQTQGKGLGKLLLHAVENIAKENRNTAIFLNVNRYNKAQEFYKNQGFSIIRTEDIDIGNGYLMEDYVMEKKL